LLKLVSIAMTVHLALVLIEGLVPQTHGFLPLGGAELSQMGAVFVGAMMLHSIFSRRPPFL